MTTKVLPYDRVEVPQDTYYNCGPASTQTVLNSRIRLTEAELARGIGTTVNGTDYVGLIERELDRRLPQARYTSVYLPNDPPTETQKTKLWWDIVRSVDNGFGVVMNWVAPPSNYPRGVKGSQSPAYGGGTVYHYVACMGWSDDGGEPALWIADSGFRPFGYWISFTQAATLIPPKGYCSADLPRIDSARPPAASPPPAPPLVTAPWRKVSSPVARTIASPSRQPRGSVKPRWIGVHTQEGGRTAEGLAKFLADPVNEVSYNTVNDDHEVIQSVPDDQAPWAAASANAYALHHCFAGSFSGWSRDKWLETDPADGKDEDAQLTLGARQVAFWCSSRDIPAVWIGGRNRPPWGLDGICGHVDFAGWGGGHSDPGGNFPSNEFIRRVNGLLTGVEQPPLIALPPVAVAGTDPAGSKYAGVLLYHGRPNNDPELVRKVQHRLKFGFASYGGHLTIDGDYGTLTEAAVREFQRRSGLVADGIVGAMTAAALKAW